jgi:hypothetical protein
MLLGLNLVKTYGMGHGKYLGKCDRKTCEFCHMAVHNVIQECLHLHSRQVYDRFSDRYEC